MNTRSLGIASTLALVAGVLFAPAASATPNELAPCSVDSLTKVQGIKSLHAEVRRADDSSVLFSRRAETPARTASVMKVITSVVALDALGPDYQVETEVYADTSSGTVYLVGSGDVTLSRMPGNIVSYYSGGPKLDSLSKQIASWAKRNRVTISQVVLDSSLYGATEDWHPTWDKRGLSQGYMAPVSALQIDAGRLTSSRNQNVFIGQRTAKPINQAGVLFLQSLRKYGLAQSASATVGKLATSSVVVASVKSQPISRWIQNTLNVSDNALAEALARLSSLALGFDGSATSLTRAYAKALQARGIDTKGMLIVDGSGLSRLNKVPAKLVNDVLAQVYGNQASHSAVIAGMPVSGKPGSLRYRFNSGEQRPALFNIEAKTGWIRTGYSLAGKIKAQDGTDLIFTVYNLWNKVSYENRAAMDKLVFGFYRCGAALSNN
ncbi:MAG: D-alanyl-D-alanine carboxypeptidase/D-alanyl-D-alanine-endopeptidase [Actinomycetota bacterium]